MADISAFREFFDNESLVQLVDELCKRYGKLPTDIMIDSTIFEYEFNTAFMLMAIAYENQRNESRKQNPDGKKVNLG